MTEILALGNLPESTQRELSNEYQHDRFQIVIKNLYHFALDESSLSIGRVNQDFYIGMSEYAYAAHQLWLPDQAMNSTNDRQNGSVAIVIS